MPAGTHLAGVFIFLFISPCFSNNKNDEKHKAYILKEGVSKLSYSKKITKP